MKYKITLKMTTCPEPFVDYYGAENETEARNLWEKDFDIYIGNEKKKNIEALKIEKVNDD